MENPKFDEYMLPMLKYLKDKNDVKTNELVKYLQNKFNLDEELKRECLPSGKTTCV